MRAFSLVELSIVLVILGLLTGSILVGQSLIRSSELQSTLAGAERHLRAIHAFRQKYQSLPGDMPDATMQWGKNASYCDSHTGAATARGTCNGNGNGIVNSGSSTYTGTAEDAQLWHQLSLAGMIDGQYTGITTSGVPDVPKGSISNAYYRTRYMGDVTGAVTGSMGSTFALQYGHILEIYGPFTPTEAWSIDTKLDDGMPTQGKAIARGWDKCTTATSRTDLSVSYNLTLSGKECDLVVLRNSY